LPGPNLYVTIRLVFRSLAIFLGFLAVLLAGLGGGGCAGTARPQLNVLGLARGERLLVEIHNPTDHDLSVSDFDWTLAAGGHPLDKGTLKVQRTVNPGGSTVVELPISGRPVGPYRLEGRLRDRDRSTWRVSVRGRFQ